MVYQVAETEKTIFFAERDWVNVYVVSINVGRRCKSLGGLIGSVT